MFVGTIQPSCVYLSHVELTLSTPEPEWCDLTTAEIRAARHDLVQKLDTHSEHLRGLCGAAHMCSITRPDNRASGLGLPDNV